MSVLSRRAMVGAAMGASLGAGCGQQSEPAEAQGPWTLRYRLRVRVEADGKVHEGSGGFQSEYRRLPLWTPMRTQEFAARGWGEAVEIDLGERGNLFALMGSVEGTGAGHRYWPLDIGLVISTLSELEHTAATFMSGEVFEMAAALHGARSLQAKYWPVFVSLDDVADPSSMRLVQLPSQQYRPWPHTRSVSFEERFGSDALLSDVMLEVVDAPVSRGIESRHHWIREVQGRDAGRVTFSTAAPLHENLQYWNLVMNGYAG